MSELSELVKSKRLACKWSLRKLAMQIGVTPAYVADIEAGRRFPSAELKERISEVLEIPSEELAAADNRLTPDLRDWIEERPKLTALLRSLRTSPESDMLIQRLTRIISRRLVPQVPRFLVTWESELRAIAAESSAWSVETGGDLFGRWDDVPTVLIATKAGPAAERNHAHFRLDVEYLRQLSETMASDWALRYFGDWHSHHRLGLSAPSSGDRQRVLGIAERNQFPNMAEIIVTLEGGKDEPTIRISPWLYELSGGDRGPFPLRVKVLPGLSPIRQALLARRALPEQELFVWEQVSLNRIRIGPDAAPPSFERAADVDALTRERTLSHLGEALQKESGGTVEQHATGFGSVLVAKLSGEEYIAFAVGGAWPMNVLEVYRLNRSDGSTLPTKAPGDLFVPNIQGILDVYRAARLSEKGDGHVDR